MIGSSIVRCLKNARSEKNVAQEFDMATFQWSSNFVTNLPKIDEQHRHLVDLINALGDHLGRDEIDESQLDSLFRELLDYTDYHFSEEERMMRRVGLDPRHVDRHADSHRRFLHDIELLKNGDGAPPRDIASRTLDYLVHWLSYHILGQDQNMARQIDDVDSGLEPRVAFEAQEREQDAAIEPLLQTLNGLLMQLFSRNRSLQELNRSLELRVDARTRALSEANAQLEALSLEDSLTGISNRRHAMIQLETLWAECDKLAALMLDADNFKEVNDQHGHDAGDAVLREIARTLRHFVRTDDLVFRLGGDEFLVLCPNTDLAGAETIAEQLRRRVDELRVTTGAGFWNSSVSIGVAARTPTMQHYHELMKAADDSVYRAKRAGRNCIRSAAPAI